MPSGEEMAPMHTGAKACVENSPHCSWAKNISLRGGCHPLILAGSFAPTYGCGDGGRLPYFTPSREEMAPMNTGAYAGDEISPCNRAASP